MKVRGDHVVSSFTLILPTLSLSEVDWRFLELLPFTDDLDELDVNLRCEARSHFLKLPLRLAAAAAAAAADELLFPSSFSFKSRSCKGGR